MIYKTFSFLIVTLGTNASETQEDRIPHEHPNAYKFEHDAVHHENSFQPIFKEVSSAEIQRWFRGPKAQKKLAELKMKRMEICDAELLKLYERAQKAVKNNQEVVEVQLQPVEEEHEKYFDAVEENQEEYFDAVGDSDEKLADMPQKKFSTEDIAVNVGGLRNMLDRRIPRETDKKFAEIFQEEYQAAGYVSCCSSSSVCWNPSREERFETCKDVIRQSKNSFNNVLESNDGFGFFNYCDLCNVKYKNPSREKYCEDCKQILLDSERYDDDEISEIQENLANKYVFTNVQNEAMNQMKALQLN